jgi:small subunit ribosomal protein S16
MDHRAPRDGRVIEELGTYDPMVPETDARVTLNNERVQYWLGVGAKPTHKAGVLIRKYGANGTHLEQQQAALERMKNRSIKPMQVMPKPAPKPSKEEAVEPAVEEVSGESASEAGAAEAAESQE